MASRKRKTVISLLHHFCQTQLYFYQNIFQFGDNLNLKWSLCVRVTVPKYGTFSTSGNIYILNEIYFLHLAKRFIVHEVVSMVEGENHFADADTFIANLHYMKLSKKILKALMKREPSTTERNTGSRLQVQSPFENAMKSTLTRWRKNWICC